MSSLRDHRRAAGLRRCSTCPGTLPLEDWPAETLAALPRGISRHVVRFARLSGSVVAIKEIREDLARREYGLLRLLNRLDVPSVEPVGVVTGRTGTDGAPLDPCLVTRHLQFSLPYRALFSQTLRPDTASRLVDALAVLLVRLHLTGFFWGDVSLSNTLFRRDAGAFAAYLVDAETGELHDHLSDGQREHDLEIARVNIAGELMDLQAGGLLEADAEPAATSASGSSTATASLWDELTGTESFEQGERWRVEARIRRLNELGFDVGELAITTDIDGATVRIQPKVVDAGHHSRRLLRLTGLDVEENQARRLLNDLDGFARRRGAAGRGRGDRRPRLAVPGVRAGGPRGAAQAARQAGAGRAVPRGARAPLVPQRAGRPRRRPEKAVERLRARTSCRTSPTRSPSSASTPRRIPVVAPRDS